MENENSTAFDCWEFSKKFVEINSENYCKDTRLNSMYISCLESMAQGLDKEKLSAKMKKTFSRLHIWEITLKKDYV